jgi:hypothetical protein
MVAIKQAIGRNQPFVEVQVPPIISQRAPATSDTNYPKGHQWIDESVSPSILYFHLGGGDWNANELTLSTDVTFTGALDTTASSSLAIKTYADNLAIAGAPDASTTVKGIVEEGLDAQVVAGTTTGETGARLFVNPGNLAALFAASPAIGGTTPSAGTFSTLAATGAINFDAGGSFESGGTTIDIGADADTAAMNFGTGAAARTITIGNVSGATAVVVNTGTGHFTVTTTGAGDIILNSDDTMLLDSDGVLELNSSAGAINIGNDDIDQAINIGSDGDRAILVGSQNAAASLTLDSGTGAILVGTTIAKSITIGNKTGATALVFNVGTGDYALDGVGASTYTVGASTTSGTVTIGGTAQTGTMTLGDSSGTNIVQIGSGEGATTVAIAGGATNAKTVTIADGAIGNLVTIGSASAAASLDLLCGTGNFTLNGAATSTYTLFAATTSGTVDLGGTAQTGTMTLGDSSGTNIVQIGSGEGATTVNVAGGATNAKVVNIAVGAVANLVTIGSASGAASLDLLCGTGNFTLEGDVASTYEISSTGTNTGTVSIGGGTGARLVNLGVGGTGAKTINIGTAAIGNIVSIGSVTAAASLDLLCGTGNFTLEGDVASTYEISSTGTNTGTCKFASGAGARIVEIAGGGTGIKTINIGAAATADVITIGTTTAAGATNILAGSGGIISSGPCAFTPDAITSLSGGVAASILTVVTEITTNGDSDLDNVTLANGFDGQVKIFAVVAVGNAADSIKITPASMIGGTQITFSANPLGLGCQMVFDAGAAGWIVTGNNGGTVA